MVKRSLQKPTGAVRVKAAKVSHHKDKVGPDAIDKMANQELSEEQRALKERIFSFCRENLSNDITTKKPAMFVIQGDAGTGKSVILNSLFNDLQKTAKTGKLATDPLVGSENYLVVNHPEMLKLYHRIASGFPYLTKRELERPTSLINRLQKERKMADVILVDEAHLLASSKDAFKRFFQENHLEELMKLARVLVVVFDDKQSLRMGSYWNLGDSSKGSENGASLSTYLARAALHETHNLKQQFRVVAEKDMQDWIREISTTKKILPHPKLDQQKRDQGLDGFDFRIWDDAQAMYEAIQQKDNEFGQCRILATYDFPYRLDGKDYFVTCDGFRLRWDRYTPQVQTPWSERPDTIEEVGSVYTIQGFDLNYVGIILGKSIGYDEEKDEIKIRPEFHDDHAAFTRKKNITQADEAKEKIILNSLNVLLTRGVKGLYICAYDPALRKRLREC
ncbi:unnamed protein product [Kuraishia capsulata CBS 1993]|uniref:Schlafen group 3-like DNA/RNA helicase domain-containing protein n=1 Tax=Kuraishia capsulata CBS 1993 TaxID=1382522 RepID=W6MRA0_9ASCO|nr:uncharacterized protein KUCA_T00005244001 [Kuraishia capsulata CBS 1993]CDK29256.1 unnamed protein product [Kuraishia capsulata CBS 1993]